MVLVTIALICIPWLFLTKPIALIIRKIGRPTNPPRVSNEDVLVDMITPEDQVVRAADESEGIEFEKNVQSKIEDSSIFVVNDETTLMYPGEDDPLSTWAVNRDMLDIPWFWCWLRLSDLS
ncbi:hypothetical protein RF11_02029 [Thelohanellus kitauei]|uniref:Uncharacterized protein n=1 Tax=Thelohanellus kitauei TaxID=669202 RepID=A0A0C2MLE2_THEKT|nr:hypothetical protein RF11_02029 [Thelohanellus kitauei]